MIRRWHIFVTRAALVLISGSISAQSLLSVSQAPNWPQAPDFSTVQIDPATGAYQTLIDTQYIGQVWGGVSALDPLKRRLFALGEIAGVPQLITINLASAITTVRPLPITSYTFFEFDPITDRILAATSAPGTPVVAIDPDTANVVKLVTTGFGGSVHPGVSSYDSIRRRLFFVGATSPLTLFVVDLSNNSVVTRQVTAPTQLYFLEYEPDTDRLISAFMTPGLPVVSIDPASGTVSTLYATGFTGGVRLHVSAFDTTTRHLFMLGDLAGAQQLLTIDLNAKTISVKPLPTEGLCLFLEFQAFIKPALPAVQVPTVQPLILILLSLVLSGLAFARLSRAAF